ncbi:MAG: hypothetical protein ACI9HK_004407, partial [Pirellulaceae bacterium]
MRFPAFHALILVALLAPCGLGGENDTTDKTLESFLSQHCTHCHNAETNKADIDLTKLKWNEGENDTAIWERVIRKVRARQMPPADAERPTEQQYLAFSALLEEQLQLQATSHPNPGRTPTLRRLTRTEYQNAIRDMLSVEIDATTYLPEDSASHGFDNVTVTKLSATLLSRYMTSAQKIARLAMGGDSRVPGGATVRIKADVTQEEHVAGLPLGTRGGTLIPYTFPRDGKYEVQIRLARDRNEEVEGLRGTHELELMVDRKRIELFTIRPPKNKDHSKVDAHLKMRFAVKAGPHDIGVTFPKTPSSLLELKREPYDARFNMHRHPRSAPAVFQVSITGPFDSKAAGESPSRKRILSHIPLDESQFDQNAELILKPIIRSAYRRPTTAADLSKAMKFFRSAARDNGFEAGIESALGSILVSPHFFFRIERDPTGISSTGISSTGISSTGISSTGISSTGISSTGISSTGISNNKAYKITDLELASRMSFFLWSSIPDEELLNLAQRNDLSKPAILKAQVERMLADTRSRSLVDNFASQWLYLRNLDSITPNLRLFPDFDDNLRQAFRQETELFFEDVIRNDRSVLELIKSDYTYLNQRLAKHYGIPHIYGSRFRKVQLPPESHRGGILRHGSILTVTSYATRTSPVIRGNWILENLLGTPAPPPPADVPALDDNTVNSRLSIRERLAEHRASPA